MLKRLDVLILWPLAAFAAATPLAAFGSLDAGVGEHGCTNA